MQVCVEQRSISDLSSQAKKAVPGIASATEMPPPGTGVPFPWPLLGKRKIKTKQDMTRAKPSPTNEMKGTLLPYMQGNDRALILCPPLPPRCPAATLRTWVKSKLVRTA